MLDSQVVRNIENGNWAGTSVAELIEYLAERNHSAEIKPNGVITCRTDFWSRIVPEPGMPVEVTREEVEQTVEELQMSPQDYRREYHNEWVTPVPDPTHCDERLPYFQPSPSWYASTYSSTASDNTSYVRVDSAG